MKYENSKGWGVFKDLKVPTGGGVKIMYRDYRYGNRLLPACVFPTLNEDWLYEPCNQDWDWGTTWGGIVREENMTEDKVFWNYFVNFNGCPEKPVQIVITVYGKAGKVIEEKEMTVAPDFEDTAFIRYYDWQGDKITKLNPDDENKNVTDGWISDVNCDNIRFLSISGNKPVSPLYCSPGLSGNYEVYILTCQQAQVEFDLELPGRQSPARVFFNEKVIPAYKRWKELFIDTCKFSPNDKIGLHQTQATTLNPTRKFGALYYLKLVPVPEPEIRPVSNPPEILFYSEPYSLAYYYELQTGKDCEKLLDKYVELGVDKIVCQMGRVGQGAIYPSKISVMKNPDFVAVGDDRQKSNGVAEMMKKINIMEVLPRVCHERGIKFLANLGTQGGSESPTCSTFYAQNKGLLHPVFPGMDGKKHGMFDYENEKVVEHATDWLLELAEYDVDGISIDYNRSPFGMSEQIITKLHRRLNEKLASKRKKLEINIRFPVDNPDFYSALLSLLENNMIDSLIPSNLFSIYPEMDLSEYAKLAEIYSKKMYACVDFFGLRYTEDWRFVTPEEMKKRCSTYLNAGSDGIFFYQSEMILSLLGQQRVVKMLKQRVSPLRKTPNWKFPSMTRAKY